MSLVTPINPNFNILTAYLDACNANDFDVDDDILEYLTNTQKNIDIVRRIIPDAQYKEETESKTPAARLKESIRGSFWQVYEILRVKLPNAHRNVFEAFEAAFEFQRATDDKRPELLLSLQNSGRYKSAVVAYLFQQQSSNEMGK
ncbi:MAG: hypothetical protein INF44_05385 [Thalassospira sp.]|jgi:hypothetical protein|nr:hypothetical protein [Thalassospira sp.]